MIYPYIKQPEDSQLINNKARYPKYWASSLSTHCMMLPVPKSLKQKYRQTFIIFMC